MSNKYRLIIRHRWALGDTVLLTALIRDIHRAHPGEYETKVETNFSNVWWNNPHIASFEENSSPRAQRIDVGWGDAIKWNAYAKLGDKKAMRHILAWYHYDFSRKTGIDVPVTDPRPDLHMSAAEIKPRVQGRYWVVLTGGKLDLTNKHWHAHRIQEAVNKLRSYGLNFVQCGATHSLHIHPVLDGVLNLIGKTDNVRDFWNVILHSEGIICPVTGAMHIAAAFNKPCVVVAGGREEPWFEAYTDVFEAFGPGASSVQMPHKFLHTIGLLPCCDVQGCWKKRVVPLDNNDLTRKAYTLCRDPVRPKNTHAVPKCMDLIGVDHVVGAVMDYYDEKLLPPIGDPKKDYPNIELIESADNEPEVIQSEPDVKAPPDIVIPKVEIRRAPAIGRTPRLIREPSVESKPQRPHQQIHPGETSAEKFDRPASKSIIPNIDNPIIGGHFTIFVLCYGDHVDLAKRCIDSIMDSVPADRIDLRVGGNELGPATLEYLQSIPITKIYLHGKNAKKYPLMREMLWDARCPIKSPYMIWFDDDAHVIDPRWLTLLSNSIISGHNDGYRMYGSKMFHDINSYNKDGHRPDAWFKAADWHNGVSFRTRGGEKLAPNGSVIDFAVGWFWALHTDVIRLGNIPDTRLNHNGGDITIGAQVHQSGFKIKQFNKGKVFVTTPTKEAGGRRVGGYEESFPWVDPASEFQGTFTI
jgi:hypothetical protein